MRTRFKILLILILSLSVYFLSFSLHLKKINEDNAPLAISNPHSDSLESLLIRHFPGVYHKASSSNGYIKEESDGFALRERENEAPMVLNTSVPAPYYQESSITRISAKLPKTSSGSFNFISENSFTKKQGLDMYNKSEVSVKLLNVKESEGKVNSRLVGYQDIMKDTDLFYIHNNARIEEYFLLKSKDAPSNFDFEISSLKNIDKISMKKNKVKITTSTGRVGFILPAPTAIDATGKTFKGQISYKEDKIKLSMDLSGAKYPVLIDPTWTSVGAMIYQRQRHTSSLMTNGNVLVAGGYSGSTFLTSAEVYDTYKGEWSSAGDMTKARVYHTSTVLPNGLVLIAGGYDGTNYLFNCEIYNPFNNTWSETGHMNSARTGHTATLLLNGTVLVSGGYNGSTYLDTSEVFDPSTGLWTSTTGNLGQSRYAHTATLLRSSDIMIDGTVLICGGFDGSNYLNTSEVYNPATQIWTSIPSYMVSARAYHTATQLTNELVLLVGGYDGTNYLSSAEAYSPSNNTWQSSEDLNAARAYHSATLLPDGSVLVSGGFDGSDYNTTCETFSLTTSFWEETEDLNSDRIYHTSTLLPTGDVLLAGGANSTMTLQSSEIYNYRQGGTWTIGAAMPLELRNFQFSYYYDGSIITTGGNNDAGYVPDSYIFDPATGTWALDRDTLFARENHRSNLLQPTSSGGSQGILINGGINGPTYLDTITSYNTTPVSNTFQDGRAFHTSTMLLDGSVIVTGGADLSTSLSSVESYDPASDTVTQLADMNYQRSYHTATLLRYTTSSPSNFEYKILVVGGFGNGDTTSEIYDIATDTWDPANVANLSTGRANHTATLLQNGKVLIAGGNSGSVVLGTCELYDPSTNTWTETGSLNNPREGHRAFLLQNGYVLVVGGSNAASISSAEIYDPYSETWQLSPNMDSERTYFDGELLYNGQVFVCGGFDDSTLLSSSEYFTPPAGYSDAWRPIISTYTVSAAPGGLISIVGTGFMGIAASSSDRSSDDGGNIPIIHLRALEGDYKYILTAYTWSDTGITALLPTSSYIMPGYYQIWVTVNGIPSLAEIMSIVPSSTTTAVVGYGIPVFMFAGESSGSNPSSQSFYIWNMGNGDLNYRLTPDPTGLAWIDATPSSTGISSGETDPQAISLDISTSSLSVGSYSQTFTIDDSVDASVISRDFDVILTVNLQKTAVISNPPELNVAPNALVFSTPSDETPSPQQLNINNIGEGFLNWYVIDDASWLSVNPPNGYIVTDDSIVSVSVDTSGLDEGFYSATITIYAEEPGVSPIEVPVNLTVTSPTNPSLIAREPKNMSFYITEEGIAPEYIDLKIWNSGSGSLAWYVSSNAVWVNLDVLNGVSTGEIDLVRVTIDSYELSAGIYDGEITITDVNAANSPITVPVLLNVAYPGDKTAPSTPTMLSPLNNALSYDASPEFSWEPQSDASGIAWSLQIDDDSDFSSPIIDETYITTETYTPSEDLSTGVYYWRVKAYDGASNESSWSLSWTLNIAEAPSIDAPSTTPTITDNTISDILEGSSSKKCFIKYIFNGK